MPEPEIAQLIPEGSVAQKPQVGWDYCKTCGGGYAVTPMTKGRCHDCQRLREFLEPVLKLLRQIEENQRTLRS